MLRRLIPIVLILALIVTVVLTVYEIATTESASPAVLGALIISAVFNLMQGADYVRDRLIPPKQVEAMRRASAGTEAEYLISKTNEMQAEEKLYVALSGEARVDPRLTTRGSKHEAEREFTDIAEAVKTYNGRFVLVGAPGAGKSTVLRALMRDALRARAADAAQNALPIWIDLGLSTNPPDAKALLDYWWTEQCYLPDTPDRHIAQKTLRLFLDGLNEMPEAGGSRADRAKSLAEFIKRNPEMPIIVTCRESDYVIPELDDKAERGIPDLPDESRKEGEKALPAPRRDLFDLGLPVVQVREMDETRIREFINKQGKDADAWWAVIDKRDALKRIAANPLTLSVLVENFAPKNAPESLTELYKYWLKEAYRRSTDRWQTGRKLEDKVRLPREVVERKLKKLAFRMMAGEKGTSAPWKWAQRQIGWRALEAGIALGLLVPSRGTVRFYHQSLQGYFAADEIGKLLNTKSLVRRLFNWISLIENSRFWRVLSWIVYLKYLPQNPVNLIRQIGDLGENGVPAVKLVIETLKDKHLELRIAAVEALGKIGDTRAVEPLINALKDESESIRSEAAAALGKIGDMRAVESLIARLRDLRESVRGHAAHALGKIGDVCAVEPLIAALRNKSESDFVRQRATYALSKIGDMRAVEPLIAALHEDFWVNREFAAIALGKLGDARAVEPLIVVLNDPDRNVRSSAADALGNIGDVRAVKPLIAALPEAEILVSIYIIKALERIGTPEALEAVAAYRRK